MTPQENQLLQDFLTQLTRAQGGTKDPEAQALIDRALARQPDAGYLLVQRTLLLEQALKQAQAQIAQLQARGSSFLGGAVPAPAYAPPAAPAAAAPALPAAATPASPWSSFLGNAAATAAGVAGGAFLFQGLENLFGHGGSGFPGGNMPMETVENVTVNNYGSDGDTSSDQDDLSDQDLDDPGDDSSWT
jgi:hypothetical protein